MRTPLVIAVYRSDAGDPGAPAEVDREDRGGTLAMGGTGDQKIPKFVPSKDQNLPARLKAMQNCVEAALPKEVSLADDLIAERRAQTKLD